MATAWEYKVKKLEGHWDAGWVETELNKLGREGWEAVGMGWMVQAANGGGDASVLLKRPAGNGH